MDELLKKMKDFSRFLELEDSIPYWELRHQEQKSRIAEMEKNLQRKEQELQNVKTIPLLRMIGRSAGKKKNLEEQIREIKAASAAVQWELETLEQKIRGGKQERQNLSGSRSAYEKAKNNVGLSPAQESLVMMAEISAFVPAALVTAERLQEMLSAALWIGQGKQDSDFLNAVEETANRLRGILLVLPEGIAPVPGFLCNPHAYLNGDNRHNQMGLAQEQIHRVINQLRLLLGA